MPQFLYQLRPTRAEMLTAGPTPDEARIVALHLDYLLHAARHHQALLFGRTQTADPAAFGIVILDLPNERAAREFMAADPAVARAVMTAELFPFRIAGGSLAPPDADAR